MPMQPFPQAMQPTWQAPPQAMQPTVRPQPAPQPIAWAPAQAVKARGVAEATPARFVLPAPESLGVASNVALPAVRVDWNQIQARMAQLGVLRYRKDSIAAGGCQVTLLLPTADPERGRPVTAQGETEASAVLLALEYAEAAVRR
jgi:hypothetical protein